MIISISIIVLGFSGTRNAATKALTLAATQISKSIHLTHPSIGSHTSKRIQILPTTFACRNQTQQSIQNEKPLLRKTIINTQKQEPESIQIAVTSQQVPSKTKGCPKNLVYFAQKPRPKQTPQECISCINLITCVCQTSD